MKKILLISVLFAAPYLAYGQNAIVDEPIEETRPFRPVVEMPQPPSLLPIKKPDRTDLEYPKLQAGKPYTGKSELPQPKVKLPESSLIPYQAPEPEDLSTINLLLCKLTVVDLIRAYECDYKGKKLLFKEFNGNGVTKGGRNTPNAPFSDINYFHLTTQPPEKHFFNYTAEKEKYAWVPFNTKIGPNISHPMPAFSAPRFYPEPMQAQLAAGAVLLPDGNPVPKKFLELNFVSDPYIPKAKILGQYDSLSGKYWLPWELPKTPLTDKNSNPTQPHGLPGNVLQGEPGPAATPLGPNAPAGNFGAPQTPPIMTNILHPTYGISTITDLWNKNSLLGHGTFSFYKEDIVSFTWGGTERTLPYSGITPDGKAFNFYFSINKIPYAISITDADKNRIYEANIRKLKSETNKEGTTVYAYDGPPFKSYAEFDTYTKIAQKQPTLK